MKSARLLASIFPLLGSILIGLLSPAEGTPLPPHLVIDGNPGQSVAGSAPHSFCKLGNISLFVAESEKEGQELWRTDGTAEGTWLVKDISEGVASSTPYGLTEWQGAVYFRATDPTHGFELWKSDGTAAGTVRLKEIAQGLVSSYPSNFFRLGNRLCFNASADHEVTYETWITDGTENGTMPLRQVIPGFPAEPVTNVVEMGGLWYFSTGFFVYSSNLWRTDGTAEGTQLIKAGAGAKLTRAGNLLFFLSSSEATDMELWRSDGTPAGTFLLRDINPGNTNSSNIDYLTAMGNSVYFAANDHIHGVELWESDGTAAGTVMVKDMSPGPASRSSSPENFFVFQNRLFFTANDWVNGRQLWTSDGSTAGTSLFKKFDSGLSSYPGIYTIVGDRFYFAGQTENYRPAALWKSDGTPDGTVMVVGNDVVGAPTAFVALGDTLLFSGTSTGKGAELWRTDGSAAGTTLVKDIFGGPNSLSFGEMATAGSRIFFAASANDYSRNLWTSDGTPEGSPDLRERAIYDYYYDSRDTRHLLAVGGRVIYQSGHGQEPDKIRTSDGTREGTGQLNGLIGASWEEGTKLTAKVGRTAFVYARSGPDQNSPAGLWKTDGSSAGTTLVLDETAGLPPIHRMAGADGILYFSAGSQYGNRTALWKSDGSAAGTVPVVNVNPASLSGSLSNLTPAGASLYFVVDDGIHGSELWISNGTAEGTGIVKDISEGDGSSSPGQLTVSGGRLFFTADDGIHGRELWVTDGSPAGTRLLADLSPGSGTSSVASLIAVGGEVFFSANDGSRGVELWKSDGSAAGTTLVKEIVPGPAGGAVTDLAAYKNSVYFAADDGIHGSELWVSDGSAAGTALVPGPLGSTPRNLCAGLPKLYFSAYEEATGRELYVYDPTSPPTVALTPPSNVFPYSLTLNGNVSPNGGATTIYLEYGLTTAYGTRISIPLAFPASDLTQYFSVPISGLDPGTTYHYRVVATNSGGTTRTEGSITTPPNSPPVWGGYSVSTLHETSVTIPLSQLNALASDPDGHDFTMVFESPVFGSIKRNSTALIYTPQNGYQGEDWIPVTLTDSLGGVTFDYLVIRVSGPFGETEASSTLTNLSDGRKSFRSTVIPNRTFQIQRSTDLINWETIGTKKSDSAGLLEFTDQSPPEGSGFYRLAYP